MKTATKTRRADSAPRGRSTTLFADEVYWANLVATLRGESVGKLLSPMIRDNLRKMVAAHSIDPDKAWSDYEAASRT